MYRPTIANKVEDLAIRLDNIPVESLALSDTGPFTTPLVSAWQVCTADGESLGLVIEYQYVPATWSDPQVQGHLRRTDADHMNMPISPSLRWVRMLPGSHPTLARNKEEALLLFDLDLQLVRSRLESSEGPMDPTS